MNLPFPMSVNGLSFKYFCKGQCYGTGEHAAKCCFDHTLKSYQCNNKSERIFCLVDKTTKKWYNKLNALRRKNKKQHWRIYL